MHPRQITGEIHLEPPPASFEGATIRVILEDVSLAGAPAQVLAEQVLRDQTAEEVRAGIRFALDAPPGEPGRAYAVRVHADLDGDGAISVGDYISRESYPVSLDQPAAPVVIRAYPVGPVPRRFNRGPA